MRLLIAGALVGVIAIGAAMRWHVDRLERRADHCEAGMRDLEHDTESEIARVEFELAERIDQSAVECDPRRCDFDVVKREGGHALNDEINVQCREEPCRVTWISDAFAGQRL